MASARNNTDQLIEQAIVGDPDAIDELFECHRDRLRKMVLARMDPRLATRVAPSDVVQDTLTLAYQRLSQYVQERPMPFYAWLRQMAWERLTQLYQHHIQVQKRSVTREETNRCYLSNDSVASMAHHLVSTGSSPSRNVVRVEMQKRVRSSLAQMETIDREVLVMRHLEQLQIDEIASLLGISGAAVRMRRLRAIRRLRELMMDDQGGEQS